jgi:hypothetical protein
MLKYEPNVIIPCKWKPTKGRLYRIFDKRGFVFNEKPVQNEPIWRHRRSNIPGTRIEYGEIFLFLGRVERVPNVFSAFHILLREKAGWLIYPETVKRNEELPVAPLRED